MAFPSDSTLDLVTAWAGLRATAGRMKATAQSMQGAASVTRRSVLEYANALADYLATLNQLSAVPGIAAYAQQQTASTVDLTAEFLTMRSQLVATQDWIVANFPATTGELRVYSFDVNKRFADINLTAPQLAAFKSQLVALITTIG